MFDTLEPTKQPVDRRLPLLMYGTYCVAGLAGVIISVSRYRLSQPIRLVLYGLMFCLSLVWLVGTLKTRTSLTSQSRYRFMVLVLLLLAVSLFR